jgi:hypothetical protein
MNPGTRTLALATMLVALAGCAETGRSGFEARMGTLVGLSETGLRDRMGAPAYDHTHEGRRVLGYNEMWTETIMVPGGGWQEVTRFCEVVFAMQGQQVAGFRSRGNGCGWAGRQNFPTA